MAKVNANGARALARAKGSNGVRYVLRSDGAVLVAWLKGDGYSILGRYGKVVIAEGERGMLAAFGRSMRRRDAVVTIEGGA